jgi:hypothetical protein
VFVVYKNIEYIHEKANLMTMLKQVFLNNLYVVLASFVEQFTDDIINTSFFQVSHKIFKDQLDLSVILRRNVTYKNF